MKPRVGRGKDAHRGSKTAAASPAIPAAAAGPDKERSAVGRLVLAGLLVLAFYGGLRIGVGEPWGYDDYYHLGVTRELGHQFPLRTFPWTPFSVLAERFVDKEPLFHVLLMPFAGLPVETAALAGALLGQAFLIGCMAWFLWSQRVPGAAGWLLGLAALGPFFALRIEQLRPHVWMLGGCVLVLGLLLRGVRPWILALVCALFGLVHTGGWVAIPFAIVWSLARRFAPADSPEGNRPEGNREARRFQFMPVLAAAGGWLLGQLVHPNLPHNFWLVWMVNAMVPLASAGGAGRSLHEAVGVELQRPSVLFLLEQWSLFVAPVLALARLVRRPESRTPAALTSVSLTVAFLLAGIFLLRRMVEVGAVLGIAALAVVYAESWRLEAGRRGKPPGGRRVLAALGLVLAAGWTVVQVRDLGRGDLRPLGAGRPLAMARFLGEHGQKGALVFTAQWADSAPLFYAAPQLKSLVVLDPTFFYAKDPQLFERYWAIAHGRSGDPVGEIGRRFGARYITIWKAPGFKPLALQLRRDSRAGIVYEDPFYEVWEIAGPGPG